MDDGCALEELLLEVGAAPHRVAHLEVLDRRLALGAPLRVALALLEAHVRLEPPLDCDRARAGIGCSCSRRGFAQSMSETLTRVPFLFVSTALSTRTPSAPSGLLSRHSSTKHSAVAIASTSAFASSITFVSARVGLPRRSR